MYMLSIASDHAASSTQNDITHILYLERASSFPRPTEALLSEDFCISPEQECGVIQTLKNILCGQRDPQISFFPFNAHGTLNKSLNPQRSQFPKL